MINDFSTALEGVVQPQVGFHMEEGTQAGKAQITLFSAPNPFKFPAPNSQSSVTILTTPLSDEELISLDPDLTRDCIGLYRFYLSQESVYTNRVAPDYPLRIQGLTDNDISVIFDHLIRCANELKMCETAIYLTADIVHRIMSKVNIGTSSPYLLASALFVTQKVEPSRRGILLASRFLAKLFGKGNTHFSNKDLYDNEMTLLSYLDFHIETITPYSYVAFFSDIANFTKKQRFLLHYFTQMCVMSPESYKYKPSALAAAGVLLANETFNMPQWNEKLRFYTTYSPADLRDEYAFILRLWRTITEGHWRGERQAVFSKFSSLEFEEVATLTPPGL